MDSYITVAAVDPGKMTGLAVVVFTVDGTCRGTTAERPFERMLEWCEKIIAPELKLDVVVSERFIITPKTVSHSFQPWSLEVTGLVRAFALRAEVPFEQYSAAEAKGAVSNDMLREIGLWHKGGYGHANDASRHAVVAAIKRGWRPSIHHS
jgi:hypothetical protein